MTGGLNPTLRAVSDAVLAVAAGLSVDEVLQRLVDSAREFAGARFAALGPPGRRGRFPALPHLGDERRADRLARPAAAAARRAGRDARRGHAYRTRDIHEHPRFRGWWPAAHPDMRSFLGVPIVAPTGVIGAFYLTEKLDAPDFSDEDEELIGLLAAHAAIAIANARLHEQTRELSIVAERNRLALDLHDAVSQKLFGLVLSAEAAATLLERDPAAARDQVAKLQSLAQEALEELRSLVFELRPPELERDGLAGALRKHVELLRRLGPHELELACRRGASRRPAARPRRCFGSRRRRSRTRSSTRGASRIGVRLGAEDGRLAARGRGRRRRLRPGRRRDESAQSRADLDGGARASGSAARSRSAPRPGAGTTVRLEIDDG